MEQFRFENLDITRASNETIAELGEVLWPLTAVRNEEDTAIFVRYKASVDALVDSFNPEQKEWFEDYQKMAADELRLAEQRRFICGFKVAMRLALDSLE